jgi:hypothetical protein
MTKTTTMNEFAETVERMHELNEEVRAEANP